MFFLFEDEVSSNKITENHLKEEMIIAQQSYILSAVITFKSSMNHFVSYMKDPIIAINNLELKLCKGFYMHDGMKHEGQIVEMHKNILELKEIWKRNNEFAHLIIFASK